MNGDKWGDTNMVVLLFCDHQAYSSHVGLFIFPVSEESIMIIYPEWYYTSQRPPLNMHCWKPGLFWICFFFFPVWIVERGLGLMILHDGESPISSVECSSSQPLLKSVFLIPAFLHNISFLFSPHVPARLQSSVLSQTSSLCCELIVCVQSPLGFVFDELNRLNFFSLSL